MKHTLTIAGLIGAIVLAAAIVGCGRAEEVAERADQAAQKAQKAAKKAQETAKEAQKAAKEFKETGETTIETDEGELTVKKEDGETTELTMESKDGEKTVASTGGDVDLSGLDIPVYPGAEQDAAKSVKSSEKDHIAVQFTTTDSFENVTAFYEEEYPDTDKRTMSTPEKKLFVMEPETDGMKQTIGVEKRADEDVVNIILEQKNR